MRRFCKTHADFIGHIGYICSRLNTCPKHQAKKWSEKLCQFECFHRPNNPFNTSTSDLRNRIDIATHSHGDPSTLSHFKVARDFLGWNIRKYDGKLLMKPSKTNVKAHLDKIREIINGNKTAKQANLIRLLNPVLRGWANYHSHVVAKKTFARVDDGIWSTLWRWAVRRHPNIEARWVKDKYFNQKVFETGYLLRQKKKRIVRKGSTSCLKSRLRQYSGMLRLKPMPIHTAKNGSRISSPDGARKCCAQLEVDVSFTVVWLMQDGLCSTCQEPITKGTLWDVCYIVKRTDGGTNAPSQLSEISLNLP